MIERHKETCFLCGQAFSFKEGGRWISYYQIEVCDPCYRSSHDGWNPDSEEKLKKHLNEKNIALPVRNTKGWLPRNPTIERES